MNRYRSIVSDHSSALGGAPRSPVHSANSSCSGVCATHWPPLLASRATTPGSGVKGSLLGTIKRAGGWYVVSPAGKKIEDEGDDTVGGGYR